MNPLSLRIALATCLLGIAARPTALIHAQQPPSTTAAQPASEVPSAALLQPADLVQMLQAVQKPVVLQVGSHVLYAEAHIPGSEYVGAGATPAGAAALRARVANLNRNQPIVLYCGCCPWGHCPNIRPAYALLLQLGFTQVKALYLPQDFGADWVDKGYPVAKGR